MDLVPESYRLKRELRCSVHELYDAVDCFRELLFRQNIDHGSYWRRYVEEIDRLCNEVKRNRQALHDHCVDDDEDEFVDDDDEKEEEDDFEDRFFPSC